MPASAARTASLDFSPGTLACSSAEPLGKGCEEPLFPRDAPESAPGARNERLKKAPSPMLLEELGPLLTGDLGTKLTRTSDPLPPAVATEALRTPPMNGLEHHFLEGYCLLLPVTLRALAISAPEGQAEHLSKQTCR